MDRKRGWAWPRQDEPGAAERGAGAMRGSGLDRRRFLLAALAAAGVACFGAPPRRADAAPVRVAALFTGRIDDRGFMEAGYRGLMRAQGELGAAVEHLDGVPFERERQVAALRELAARKPDLVVAHGGQNNEPAKIVAAQFPEVRFVVTQGNVAAPNLASYEVLQEHSAYLAGAAAGLLTRTGVVGHMSGIRVPPGLRGRAAFAAGLRATKPTARLLSNFSGNQDDVALAKRIALAEIDAGADIIFTMLNAGRAGAIDACRERGVKQIGNVGDWVATTPDVFIGSAFADVGVTVFNAVRDLRDGRWQGGRHVRIGLEDETAVRLILASDAAAAVGARLEPFAADIRAGRLAIPTEYDGPEFTPA